MLSKVYVLCVVSNKSFPKNTRYSFAIKSTRHAWNPCTKTTIFNTRALLGGAVLRLNGKPSESIDPIWLSNEFSLGKRRGTFNTCSTTTIGVRKGSPNICMSWIERLLICKIVINISLYATCKYQTFKLTDYPHLFNALSMKFGTCSCSLKRLYDLWDKVYAFKSIALKIAYFPHFPFLKIAWYWKNEGRYKHLHHQVTSTNWTLVWVHAGKSHHPYCLYNDEAFLP